MEDLTLTDLRLARHINSRGLSRLDLPLDHRRTRPMPTTPRLTCSSLVTIRNMQDSTRTRIISRCTTLRYSIPQCHPKEAVAVLFWSPSRSWHKIQSRLTKHRNCRCASSSKRKQPVRHRVLRHRPGI